MRAVEPSDAERLWRWHNDPEIMQWMHAPYPTSRDEVDKQIAERRPNNFESVTLIIEAPGGEPVGLIALTGAAAESRAATLDIYMGEKTSWGQGFATDAVRAVCRYGFHTMNLHRVALAVAPDNAAARRVYEKVGFVVEGRRREVYFRNGKWCDEWLMSLLQGELR